MTHSYTLDTHTYTYSTHTFIHTYTHIHLHTTVTYISQIYKCKQNMTFELNWNANISLLTSLFKTVFNTKINNT